MENDKLTPRQQRAIAALLSTSTTAEAAREAKIAERTLRRWLAEDEAFKRILATAEADLIAHATRRLLGLQDKAVEVIERVLDDADVGVSTKLRAADMVFGYGLRLRELHGIEQRLSDLEAKNAGGD